jgi:ABC-type arginine transport system permease subunit
MDSVWEYRGLLLEGTVVTVQLALASLALSVLLGLIGASANSRLTGPHEALLTPTPHWFAAFPIWC